MKRILLTLNTAKAKTNALDFACFIARLTGSDLTVLSFEPLYAEKAPAIKAEEDILHFEKGKNEYIPENRRSDHLYEHNKALFSNACQSREVNFSFCVLKTHSLKAVISETRFADLLIVDPEIKFSGDQQGLPTEFAKELLLKSECAVILAPYSFDGIDEIVFAYDGSKSSVFAIKQFTFLFPELADKKVTVVQVNNDEPNKPIVQEQRIRQLLNTHYDRVHFETLSGQPAFELVRYLIDKRKTFIVLGAFGRNMLSNFLKESTADKVVSTANLPFFISHC
jgi:nucleotide-binding universal stress UspA family protein